MMTDGSRFNQVPKTSKEHTMKHISKEMQACIDECLRCYQTCLGTAMKHCLETGGKHVEPKHFRLMIACSEICRTAAHFMLLNSPHHKRLCRECAEICTECAKDCERVGDMDDCVQASKSCAASCRAMASQVSTTGTERSIDAAGASYCLSKDRTGGKEGRQ